MHYYALSMLEVIKHFFDVPNVHFILGVNLKELANSVRARYGSGSNAEKYIQKFISISMPLAPPVARTSSQNINLKHYEEISDKVGFRKSSKQYHLYHFLKLVKPQAKMSLRDVEKIVTLAMVTPFPNSYSDAPMNIYVALLVIHVVSPSLIDQSRIEEVKSKDIFNIFDFKKNSSERFERDSYFIWNLIDSSTNLAASTELVQEKDRIFGERNPQDVLRNVISETVDVFRLNE